jgi:hypothetical protein
VLHGLASKPEILHTVAMLPAGGTDLGCQAAEYVTCDSIHDEERLASNSMQRGETSLADSRFLGSLSSEPQFRNGDWRQVNRFVVGESGDIGWGQEAALHIDPYARID